MQKRLLQMLTVLLILVLTAGCGSGQFTEDNPYRLCSMQTEHYRDGQPDSLSRTDYSYDANGLSRAVTYRDDSLYSTADYTCSPGGIVLASRTVFADGRESNVAYNQTMDKAGRVVYKEVYVDGRMDAVWEYAYDDDGNTTMEKCTRADDKGEFLTDHVYKDYDRKGNLIREVIRRSDMPGSDVLYLYHSGRLVRTETYSESGDPSGYTEYSYDDTSLTENRSTYDADGTLVRRSILTFDEYGNLLTEERFTGPDGNIPEEKIQYTYERKEK